MCGYTVTMVITATVALRSDWEALAIAARKRSEAAGVGVADPSDSCEGREARADEIAPSAGPMSTPLLE